MTDAERDKMTERWKGYAVQLEATRRRIEESGKQAKKALDELCHALKQPPSAP